MKRTKEPPAFVIVVHGLGVEEGTGRALDLYLMRDRFGLGQDGFVNSVDLAARFPSLASANAWFRDNPQPWRVSVVQLPLNVEVYAA